jgi:protein subunit release factor A
VLPLSEEAEPAVDDNLFKMEDVRIEVMRSRGAGGQVRVSVHVSRRALLNHPFLSTSTKLSRQCV